MLLFRTEEESCFLVSVSSYTWQLPQGKKKKKKVGSCPGLNLITLIMRKIGPNGFGLTASKCLFKYVFLLRSEKKKGPEPTSHTLTV